MPFFKTDNKLINFYHIPKCAGTTIENSIIKSGLKLSFLDNNFNRYSWTKSSPQHIIYSEQKKLFDEDFFDYEFAIVRNPVDRFISAYNHHRRKIGRFSRLDNFLKNLHTNVQRKNDYFGTEFDNHFVPASRFISPKTDIFYLENGMQNILDELSRKIEYRIVEAQKSNIGNYQQISRHKKNLIIQKIRRRLIKPSPRVSDLKDHQIEIIKNIYQEDFVLFKLK